MITMLTAEKNRSSKKSNDRLAGYGLFSSQGDQLRQLFSEPMPYVFNMRFYNAQFMTEIMRQRIESLPGKRLSAQDEKVLFMQLHFSRHVLSRLRRRLQNSPTIQKGEHDKLRRWHKKQIDLRNKIAICNLGLVYSAVRRFKGSNGDFPDLVSEGSLALIRAIDRFDWTRGYKFSTYAYRAIQRAVWRSNKDHHRYHSVFPIHLQGEIEDDFTERRRQEACQYLVEEIKELMNDDSVDLSDTERLVIERRFALNNGKDTPETLVTIGKSLGLCKERIRQIQNNALEKIRSAVHERLKG